MNVHLAAEQNEVRCGRHPLEAGVGSRKCGQMLVRSHAEHVSQAVTLLQASGTGWNCKLIAKPTRNMNIVDL
jgi:hypothetical protein